MKRAAASTTHEPGGTSPRLGRRLLTLVVLCLTSWLGGVEALAQPSDSPPIAPPLLELSSLDLRWHSLRASEPGSSAEGEAFELLLTARAELGIPSLADHASILVSESSRADAAGRHDRANQLITWAQALAPDSPEPIFAQANQLWERQPWALPRLAKTLGRAYGQADSPADRLLIDLLKNRTLLWLILGIAFVFGAAQLFRYARVVGYDLSSRVGHAIGPRRGTLLVLMGVLLPGIALRSPILAVLLALVVVSLFQRRSEIAVSLLICLALLAVPFLTDRMGGLVAAGVHDPGLWYRAAREPCDSDCREHIEALAAAHPEDAVTATVAARVSYRRGTREALDTAEATLASVPVDNPVSDHVHLVRGNIAAARGDVATARASYEAVLADAHASIEARTAAHFNLYRILHELGRIDEGDTHLSEANALDRTRVMAFIDTTERRTNRWLMDALIDPQRLYAHAIDTGRLDASTATLELWSRIEGRMTRGATSALALVAFAAILLGVWLRRLGNRCQPCPHCGGVVCDRDAPDAADMGYCIRCYDLFAEGAQLQPSQRRALEARLDRFARLRRRSTLAANALGAGLGFLGRGLAHIGAPLLALAVLGVVLLLCPWPGQVRPAGLAAGQVDGRLLLALGCLGLAYATAWGLSWVRRRWL